MQHIDSRINGYAAEHTVFARLAVVAVLALACGCNNAANLPKQPGARIGTAGAQSVPTPDMAMSWNQKKDSREWVSVFQGGNQTRILTEFVPKGDDIQRWKEMVIHQIDFTPVTLREYVDGWKAMLVSADPKIKITEDQLGDGSFLMTFQSITPQHTSDELCVRRFVGGSDGVYQIAYSVRPSLKDEETWKTWSEILAEAKLVPNPLKRK